MALPSNPSVGILWRRKVAMMETSDILKKAWAAVQDAGLPDKLHEVGFLEAVRLLSPQQPAPVVTASGAAAPKPGNVGTNNGTAGDASKDGPGTAVSEELMYDRVVTQTGVSKEKLERLVFLDEDGPRLALPGIKLGRNTADRARAVAQVLTIVRGFGLGEDATSLDVIRAECIRLKVYDSPNFSSQVTKMDGYPVTGSGAGRRLRARGTGITGFPALVDRLLGESA
jgi:hypothetical protein